MIDLHFAEYDCHPPEKAALVDAGLDASNAVAAPLNEVQFLSCFATTTQNEVAGGAVGRWWGQCCELQQLWVAPMHRGLGVGADLVRRFEQQAMRHGCTAVYLETFSFQSPALYTSLGYQVEYERIGYPDGISKFYMVKHLLAQHAAS